MGQDYVTLECARLLQKKGFPLQKVYKDKGDRPLFYSLPKEHSDWSRCDAWYYPTLWEVQRWFREEKGIHIVVQTIFDNSKAVYMGSIVSIAGNCLLTYSYGYEEALQDGIMGALNLLN